MPSDPPAGIGFAPDRLVEDQRCLRCTGTGKPEKVAGNCPAIIVKNNGEPRPFRFSRFIANKDWQQ